MATYIVIKDILNFRDRPVLADENFIGEARLGDILELSEQPIPGEIPAGTDDAHWLADNRGRFVSRAGVALKGTYAAKKAVFLADAFNRSFFDVNDRENEDKWKVSWGHVDMELWKLWKQGSKGKDITVAIIDTGISIESIGTGSNVLPNLCFNVFDKSPNVPDDTGHGTKSAGLIVANGKNGFFGIASEAKLVMVKANFGFLYKNEDIAAALEYLIDKPVDIISLSLELFTNSDRLEKAIQDCLKAGKIILSACGDEPGVKKYFPASLDGVISVGAYQVDSSGKRIYFPEGSSQSETVKFLAPGRNLLTTNLPGNPGKYNKTSAATAFACGAIALMLSALQKAQRPNGKKIAALLPVTCDPILVKQGERNNSEGYGVFNLFKIIGLIKP